MKKPSGIDFSLIEEFIQQEGIQLLKYWEDYCAAQFKTSEDTSVEISQDIEGRFHQLCQTYFPDFGFNGESYISREQSEYVWRIDPIDGTRNFAHGIPLWSMTISLLKHDSPIYGVIYNPITRQLYSAAKDKGTYLNGKRLRITPQSNPSDEQLAIDFRSQQEAIDQRTQEALLGQLFNSFRRVRAIGNGSLALAWLAQGHFGAYLSWGIDENQFNDIAAGLIIAEEAGALFEMTKLDSNRTVVTVGSEQTLEHLAKLIDTSTAPPHNE